jgi:3-hydroxybutyryl-CoA dehydrogenase
MTLTETEAPSDSLRKIKDCVVVGGGVMGNGIAQTVAQSGFSVTVVDVSEPALEKTIGAIEKSLSRMVKAGRTTAEEARAARERISTTTDLDAAAGTADHVIETVVEDLEIKQDVLGRIDAASREEVVMASNTSQFSISRLAASTSRPDRVVGSHWFNPPPIMGLIELIRGVETSDKTLELARELGERYGKRIVICKKDTPGFITSRLIVALAMEAARIVEEGIADAADVDTACELAFNHRMGPLNTIDLSGLDTTLRVADAMRDQYGERFLAPQNLRALVNAGHYGKKTGRGLRDHGDD